MAFCLGEKKIRAHLTPMLQVLDDELDSNYMILYYNIQVEPHAIDYDATSMYKQCDFQSLCCHCYRKRSSLHTVSR